MPAATPANSAQSVPVLAITRAREHERRGPRPVVLADQGQQALAGDDPEPHAELVEDDQRRGREGQNPEQLVAVLGAEDRVGGDPGRVVVGEAGQHARADHGEQRRHPAGTEQEGAAPGQVPVQVATGGAVGAGLWHGHVRTLTAGSDVRRRLQGR